MPVVTEPATGRSNANGEFTRANGTLVQAAGTFLNGPDRDKGPSDNAIDHVFQANGMVELPYQIQLSGIFRAQSGFHFSQAPASGVLVDPDGDASVNGIDVNAGRNAFTTPPFVNLDMRFAKRFNITSGVKAQVLLEFFNVFNRQNPAAVGRRQDVALEPFGRADAGPARAGRADRFPDRVLGTHFSAAAANSFNVASSVGGCRTLVDANSSFCGYAVARTRAAAFSTS